MAVVRTRPETVPEDIGRTMRCHTPNLLLASTHQVAMDATAARLTGSTLCPSPSTRLAHEQVVQRLWHKLVGRRRIRQDLETEWDRLSLPY